MSEDKDGVVIAGLSPCECTTCLKNRIDFLEGELLKSSEIILDLRERENFWRWKIDE